jgi:hypothetical protein
MNCDGWNASELRQLANGGKWLLLEGIKNGVLDNGVRMFFGVAAGNRVEFLLAWILAHDGACDRIQAERRGKFVEDGLSRKSFD